MEFTLYYHGKLKGKGDREDKHEIRKQFHEQLRVLWDSPPLKENRMKFLNVGGEFTSLREISGYYFAPLVYEKIDMVAELDITMLRPEKAGSIISHGGDIDNRLKTLFDALRMPRAASEIPPNWAPGENERPLYCVLEDDSLVVNVTVKTDRLLVPVTHQLEVVMLVKVKTKSTRTTMLNLDLL